MRRFLPLITFDDALYLEMYPDVENAVKAGAIKSARDHFIAHGYFEGRVFQQDPIHLDLPSELQG